MRARDVVGQVPRVETDLPVIDAARIQAAQCAPGLIVVDADRRPVAVLPDVEVLQLIVPTYIQYSAVISAEATVEETAALMVGTGCSPAAVVDQSVSMLGVVTLDSPLKRMFAT